MADLSSLPSSVVDWELLIDEQGLRNTSIHSFAAAADSGSKVQMRQFLLLQVLWYPREKGDDLFTACQSGNGPISPQHIGNAYTFLNKMPSWKSYIKSFPTVVPGSSVPVHAPTPEGTFVLAQYYQQLSNKMDQKAEEELIRRKVAFTPKRQRIQPPRPTQPPQYKTKQQPPETPMPKRYAAQQEPPRTPPTADAGMDSLIGLDVTPSTPIDDLSRRLADMILSPSVPVSGKDAKLYKAIEDEQIVNTALVLFLNALTIHFKPMTVEWSPYRYPFIMKNRENDKIYEARVDGLMRTLGTASAAKAIIEVKPHLRHGSSVTLEQIRMQESAQMAAWISSEPPPRVQNHKHRRVIISQDRHEIYVTVGTFDDNYVRYVQDEVEYANSFLYMREYGPFNVNKPKQMDVLGYILLGLSIQGGT